MADGSLRNCRILVVEDEYFLADELQAELEDAGANVLGPVGTVEGALEMINAEERIDGAILDVNLRGEMVFDAAELLAARNVPFMFTTGYDQATIPSRFADVARCEKPVTIGRIKQAVSKLIQH